MSEYRGDAHEPHDVSPSTYEDALNDLLAAVQGLRDAEKSYQNARSGVEWARTRLGEAHEAWKEARRVKDLADRVAMAAHGGELS
jgi:hypothetical protein